MDTLIIIGILVLVAVALYLVLHPLWQSRQGEAANQIDPADQTAAEYQVRYQSLLTAITELTFDHEMGKVSTEDYETLVTRNKVEAAKLRQEIDQLDRSVITDPINSDQDIEIEALISQFRNGHIVDIEGLLQEVDAELKLLKKIPAGTAYTTGFTCTNCGKSLNHDDAFCSQCGQPVMAHDVAPDPNACPQCDYPIQPDDLFCAKCGTTLTKDPAIQSYEDAKS